MHSFGISFHCYADDLQIYMPVVAGNGSDSKLMACLAAVRIWLSTIFLLLMIAIAPAKMSHHFDLFTLSVCDCVFHCKDRI